MTGCSERLRPIQGQRYYLRYTTLVVEPLKAARHQVENVFIVLKVDLIAPVVQCEPSMTSLGT